MLKCIHLLILHKSIISLFCGVVSGCSASFIPCAFPLVTSYIGVLGESTWERFWKLDASFLFLAVDLPAAKPLSSRLTMKELLDILTDAPWSLESTNTPFLSLRRWTRRRSKRGATSSPSWRSSTTRTCCLPVLAWMSNSTRPPSTRMPSRSLRARRAPQRWSRRSSRLATSRARTNGSSLNSASNLFCWMCLVMKNLLFNKVFWDIGDSFYFETWDIPPVLERIIIYVEKLRFYPSGSALAGRCCAISRSGKVFVSGIVKVNLLCEQGTEWTCRQNKDLSLRKDLLIGKFLRR